jgi:hypothetical protein
MGELPANPAMVLTTQLEPTGVIFRIVSFASSATKTLPALSTATPQGF